MQITKTKQKEWEERIEALKHQIQYWIDNPTEKTIWNIIRIKKTNRYFAY